MKVKVFLDLDDTLADTSKAIEIKFLYKNYGINTSILNKNIKLIKDLLLWRNIKNNPYFWKDIPKREQANEIYEEALKIAKTNDNIHILTALPKLIFKKDTIQFNNAAENKIKWVKKNFPEIPEKNIMIVHAIEKKKYAISGNESAVLFDDSIRNIKAWKNAGGIAYLVTPKGFEKY